MYKKSTLMPNKYFFFSASIFLICYIFTLIQPDFFTGTDSQFYISLLKGEPNEDFKDPIFNFMIFLTRNIFNPENGYLFLGIFSLLMKSYFLSILFSKNKNSYASIAIFILIYFTVFYSRFEIGSLRNAYGINLLQFTLLFRRFYNKAILTLITYWVHYPSGLVGFSWLLFSYFTNTKKINLNSISKNIRNFIFNLKVKIPKKLNLKLISIFFISFSIIFFLGLQIYLSRILQLVFSIVEADFERRSINIFTYGRFYIIFSTLISSFILLLNFKDSAKDKSENKYLFKVNNELINLFIPSIVFVTFFSLLPASIYVQRVGLMISYFCLISNLIVLKISSPLEIFFKKISLKTFRVIFFTLISLTIISSDLAKIVFKDQYLQRIEDVETDYRE